MPSSSRLRTAKLLSRPRTTSRTRSARRARAADRCREHLVGAPCGARAASACGSLPVRRRPRTGPGSGARADQAPRSRPEGARLIMPRRSTMRSPDHAHLGGSAKRGSSSSSPSSCWSAPNAQSPRWERSENSSTSVTRARSRSGSGSAARHCTGTHRTARESRARAAAERTGSSAGLGRCRRPARRAARELARRRAMSWSRASRAWVKVLSTSKTTARVMGSLAV
jgi:hypothetical protein